MRTPTLLVLVLGTLAGCSSSNYDHYVRFEPLGLLPAAQSSGLRQVLDFQGELYVLSSGELGLYEGGTVLEGATAAAVVDERLVVATPTGILQSTDGVGFEPISEEVLEQMVAVDSDLVGARLVGTGLMEVLRSHDAGATWVSLGADLSPEYSVEQGSDSVYLSAAAGGLVWARVSGDADLGPNWAYSGSTWEVRGEALTLLSGVAGQALPDGETLDGLTLVNVKAEADGSPLGTPHDTLPITLVSHFKPAMDFADTLRLSFAMPDMPIAPPEPRLFGFDAEGHLLAALDDTLVRTELPLRLSNDRTSDVLAGSGCKGRASYEGYSGSERPDLTVVNESDELVSVWSIDHEQRWSKHADVPAGASQAVEGFALVDGTFVMALDAMGNCAAGAFVEEGTVELELVIP